MSGGTILLVGFVIGTSGGLIIPAVLSVLGSAAGAVVVAVGGSAKAFLFGSNQHLEPVPIPRDNEKQAISDAEIGRVVRELTRQGSGSS